jgi:hypothetical protein
MLRVERTCWFGYIIIMGETTEMTGIREAQKSA